MEHEFLDGQFSAEGGVFESLEVNECLLGESGVVEEGVVWVFAEDGAAELFREVVDVGVAVVAEVVQRAVAEEGALASALRLECDARNQVHGRCLVGNHQHCADAVGHVGADLAHQICYALLLSLLLQVGECFSGEYDVAEGLLLVR